MRFRQVLFGEFTQAFLAVDGHEDSCHQRDERLMGADVGRSFLATYMLLSSCQRQAKRAIAARVLSFTHKATWDLPHELFLGGNDSRERPAIAGGNGKRLQLA